MPLYRFKTVQGKGILEADSLTAAKEKLRVQQMMVIYVKPCDEIKASMSGKHVLAVTRLIAQLLKAGIPIYEAVTIVEERFTKAPFHPILVSLSDRLKKGEPFSQALELYPAVFSPVYRALIKAGEVSGNLHASCEALVELLESKQRLKKKLVAATTYPIFLFLFCLAVFISLLAWVIPSLKNLFEGRALHPLTAAVFELSDFFLAHTFAISFLVALLCAVLSAAIFHPHLRACWDLLILKLPGLGPLAQLAATARFCRTSALLLQGGEPLLSALESARPIVGNHALHAQALSAEKAVASGAPLSQHVTWMPPFAGRMLAVAEKSGQMGPMLFQISLLCEEEFGRFLAQYTALIQPVLLLLLGLLIGTVVLSILIPLTDVGSML